MSVMYSRWLKWLKIGLTLSVVAFGSTAALARQGLPDFVDLVSRHGPSVVNISITQTSQLGGHGGILPFDKNDPMYEFFRRFMPQIPNMPREYKSRSLGSGFIISEEGYILTNAHVVSKADEIVVRLTDKREFKAKVIGADKRTDVALIKVEANGLPAVNVGKPKELQVGEWVVAIGSPFGFDNSVTSGIVSAKGRSLPQENYVPFIQTDVPINPGNSGGPLFNLAGEVVGINSQIYSRSGGYQGISFAIPIDVAMDVAQQLKKSGRVTRGRIGVVIQDVTKELAENFGLSRPEGAIVNAVEPNGPADEAGLKQGDVILSFNGRHVEKTADLPRYVAETAPGSRATVEVWRGGKTKTFRVVVGEIDDDQVVAAHGGRKDEKPTQGAANRLGLVLSEIPASKLRKLRLRSGLRVMKVRSNASLRPGDILIALIYQGTSSELKTVAQFNRLLKRIDKNARLSLLVRRGDVQSFVTIRAGKR